MSDCRLYAITPPKIDPKAFVDVLDQALSAGDVAALQLRLKDASDSEIRRAAELLMPVARRHDTAFIMNDRPDLARELGCDGVHVGQDDMPYSEARRLLGEDVMIGVTCHDSRHLAIEAAEQGADYVAFGAFFATTTKEAKFKADLELLSWWSEMMVVPCVAIGGITVANARILVDAGADFLAVSAGVWEHSDGPRAAVEAFNDLFRDGS